MRRQNPPLTSLAFLSLGFLFLAGCGSLLESNAPPTSTWWLTPTQLTPAKNDQAPLVVHLTVVPGLDTDRMLTLDEAARLNHFAGARWPDHLPEVLGSLVVRSLETGRGGPVRAGDHARAGECLLNVEMRAFWTRLGDGGSARSVEVELAGRLSCPEGERTVGVRRTEPVREDRLRVIVAAFQQALDGALADLADPLAAPTG